jgi:ribosomal protein S18 acetylase RimI-like enzyme
MSRSASSDIRFRRATTADAALLARLGAELFAQAFAAQNTPENMSAYLGAAFSEERQRHELEDESTRAWVAEADGASIGYAQIKVGADHSAELVRIYADRVWHGRGVGQALLDHCVDGARAAGAKTLWLGVWERNPRAIAFYEKHGFRVVGEQAFQLGADAQRDIVMVKELPLRD